VPDPEHEALRDLVRGREDAIVDRMRVRRRIKKMLLRQGIRRPEGMRAWSKRWRAWLGSIELAYSSQQVVWREYLGTLDELHPRIDRYNEALHEQAQTSSKAYLIAALQILKEIAKVNAVTLVAELGDLMRFARPARLISCSGMVPAEYSSGGERYQGHITKTGNRHVRRALTEAAWAYRYPPSFKVAWHCNDRPHHIGWSTSPGEPRSGCTAVTGPSSRSTGRLRSACSNPDASDGGGKAKSKSRPCRAGICRSRTAP